MVALSISVYRVYRDLQSLFSVKLLVQLALIIDQIDQVESKIESSTTTDVGATCLTDDNLSNSEIVLS